MAALAEQLCCCALQRQRTRSLGTVTTALWCVTAVRTTGDQCSSVTRAVYCDGCTACEHCHSLSCVSHCIKRPVEGCRLLLQTVMAGVESRYRLYCSTAIACGLYRRLYNVWCHVVVCMVCSRLLSYHLLTVEQTIGQHFTCTNGHRHLRCGGYIL